MPKLRILFILCTISSWSCAAPGTPLKSEEVGLSDLTRAIDVLPGLHCRGNTTLHSLDINDTRPKLKVVHKENDPPKKAGGQEFFGYFRIKPRINVEVKASNKGNCCWEYYSKPGFKGKTFQLNLGEAGILLSFKPRSVKVTECPTQNSY